MAGTFEFVGTLKAIKDSDKFKGYEDKSYDSGWISRKLRFNMICGTNRHMLSVDGGKFADEHNIDDVWRNISLDPNITDEMIRKAGFTKAQILEEWKWFNDSPTDWMEKQNIRGDEYGIVGNVADTDDFSSFGRLLSAYIKAKAEGKTLAQQEEEYYLSKAEEEPEEENYKVWQDDSTEEEKDEVKKDRNFDGMFF